MNTDPVIFLPNIILLGLFVLFLWRRHSPRGFDWMTLAAIILGVALLASVIVLVFGRRPEASLPLLAALITAAVLMLAVFLLFLTRVLTVEKLKSRFHIDERIAAANAKSARNALVVTYLNLIIDLIIFSSISQGLLLGILAVSLLVYLASMIIYYYRSF